MWKWAGAKPGFEAALQGVIAWCVAAGLLAFAFKTVAVRADLPWAIALLALLAMLGLPVWLGVAVGRRRYRALMGRYALGHCQACGYDLTGNVSGKCPECGAVVP